MASNQLQVGTFLEGKSPIKSEYEGYHLHRGSGRKGNSTFGKGLRVPKDIGLTIRREGAGVR